VASKKKDFNKRITIEIDGKEVNRHRAVLVPTVKKLANGTGTMQTSDRNYTVEKDGSLRSMKTKISKKERRRIRDLQESKPKFPIPQPATMKVTNAD
jgi:hypothetical protein